MKPVDSKGEYTPDEVKAALAGVDGTRSLSFRYEHLDNNNAFIEEIDYIQSCSIENNSLADIKRTAKFDILDTGSINYLQDRIKPYVRIEMPEDETYDKTMRTLDPAVWWKLDDTTVAPAVAGVVSVPDDLSFGSAATADHVDLTVANSRNAHVQMSSGTVRSEYWSYVDTSTQRALQLQVVNNAAYALTFEVYSAATPSDSLTLIRTTSLPVGANYTYVYPLPSTGVYLTRVVGQSVASCAVSLTYFSAARLEDSSGHGVYGTGSGLSLGAPSVVLDGGTSLKTSGAAAAITTNDPNIFFRGGVSVNYWVSGFSTGNQIQTSFGSQGGNFTFYLSDDGAPGVFKMVATFSSYDTLPAYSSTVNIPAGRLTTAGPKMVTVAVDPAGKGVRLFINGVVIGTFADMSAYIDLFNNEYISYTYQGNYSTGTAYFDDFSLHSTGLPLSMISKLYQKGASAKVKRSGYVEWPQGVFLLSSPKRTMVDGTYVHRDVEGYDQLVVLQEDSFDYRYSVAAGTKYTDAVKNILQTSIAKQDYPLNEAQWSTTGGASVLNAYAAVMTMDASALNTSNNFSPLGMSMSSKVSFSTTDTSYTVEYKMVTSTGDVFGYTITNGTTLAATGLGAVALKSATYSASTHAYLRLRESNNVLYFETSTNGSTWTQFITQAHTLAKTEPLRAYIAANNAGAGDLLNVGSHRLSASIALRASIQATTKTLPTILEWDIGTPKLDIINDLLTAINYETATYNESGMFTTKAYLSPDVRTSQYTYATDASSVISGDVNQTIDLYKIPNKWVVVVSDPDRPALIGSYTNTNPLSPTSTVSRGRTIVDYRDEQKAPDGSTLTAQAQRLAFEASQVFEVIEFETAVMPIHQNADVYTLVINGLAVNSKFAEHSWSMDLEVGGTMKHTVRKVVSL